MCSVVVGQDLVPRLGVSSMEHLKVQLLQLIRDSSKPKVNSGGLWLNPEDHFANLVKSS